MPERRWVRAAALLSAAGAALVASGCAGGGDGDRDAGFAGTVDTLASGVVVTDNPATPMLDSAHGWRLEETLRIGATDGEGPDVFSDVRDVAVDHRGRIHVLQQQAANVQVFDSTGRFLHTVGGPGEGPGELKQPTGIAFDPAGRLWVADPGNARFTAYDSMGAPVASHRREVDSYRFQWDGAFLGDGRLVEPFASVRRDGVDGEAVLRFDSTFVPRDTLLFARDPANQLDAMFVFRQGGGTAYFAVPFFPSGVVSRITADGVRWDGNNADYRLVERRLAGDTVRVVTRAYEPVPVVDDDLAGFLESARRFGTPDRSRIPKVKPAFSEVLPAPDGTLWVRLHRPHGETGAVFDVFDGDGRYLTQVRAPADLAAHPALVIRDGALYGVTKTELDVPQVIRLRIVRP